VSPGSTLRLRWHAGLEDDPVAPACAISSCIDLNGRIDERLRAAVDDAIDPLSDLNAELDGRQRER
jgi:hypothetical protein